MSAGNFLGYGVIKVVVDDSELMPSLRSAFARMQAEVDARGIKVPITANAGTSTGRPTTFAGAQSGATITPMAMPSSFGGFAPNRPTSPNAGTAFIDSGARFDVDTYGGQMVRAFNDGKINRSQLAASLTPGGIKAAEKNFYQSQREYESRSARVEANWDAAALAKQKEDERSAGKPLISGASARRMIAYGLLGAHEGYRTNLAIDDGEIAASLATSRSAELRARIVQQREAWGGVIGSAAGFGLDLFGAGPRTFIRNAAKSLAASDAQDELRLSRISQKYGYMAQAATASGDSVQLRRIEAQKSIELAKNTYDHQIEHVKSELAATEDYQYATGQTFMGTDGGPEMEFATAKRHKLTGSLRQEAQAKLATLEADKSTEIAAANGLLSAVTRDLAESQRRMRYMAGAAASEALGGGSIRTLGVGGVGLRWRALQELNRQAVWAAPEEQKSDATSLGMARNFQFGMGFIGDVASNAMSKAALPLGAMNRARFTPQLLAIHQATMGDQPFQAHMLGIDLGEKQAKEQNNAANANNPVTRWLENFRIGGEFQRQRDEAQHFRAIDDTRITRRLMSQREMINLSLNPQMTALGFNATSIANDALEGAEGLKLSGRKSSARDLLVNARWALIGTQQDYLRSIRGQQVDLRSTDVSNPNQQADVGGAMKQLEKKADELIQVIRELGSN